MEKTNFNVLAQMENDNIFCFAVAQRIRNEEMFKSIINPTFNFFQFYPEIHQSMKEKLEHELHKKFINLSD